MGILSFCCTPNQSTKKRIKETVQPETRREFSHTRAQFSGVDEAFVEQSEKLGISQAHWDAPEYAAASFPNAYKYTRHYRISRGLLGAPESVLVPEELVNTGSLNLSRLTGQDIDGEHDLITLLRDRLKNHSMVVLKDNKIVHQHYWNGMDEHATHLDMSVTKSFTSLLASIAVAEGKLDMHNTVESYLPFLKGTAFEGTTIQEVADMRSGLDIPTPKFLSWDPRLTQSQEWNGKNESGLNGVKEYVKLIKERKYPAGKAYQYQDPNTEVLGMVVEAATGENLADYMQQKLWKQVGVDDDAFWMADPTEYVVASGGLNITTRDLARVGRMLLNNGRNYLNEPIINPEFITNLWTGNQAVREAWKYGKESKLAPNGWYKDQFRVLNIKGQSILCMVGIHGQVLAMNKTTNTVIAMNGGYPQTETPRMAKLIFYEVIPAILEALED
ncbi:class C beta-lactamase-related serine hydrolase [Marinilabiliaceae bacterium JC017]|nr:class C beta-lactamase-related serine hydrolase [Marinilabiliaceae bacterium JC017]